MLIVIHVSVSLLRTKTQHYKITLGLADGKSVLGCAVGEYLLAVHKVVVSICFYLGYPGVLRRNKIEIIKLRVRVSRIMTKT